MLKRDSVNIRDSWIAKKPTANQYLPDWEPADALALQALQRGDASPDQQIKALEWILYKAAGTNEEHYAKGLNGDRDTAYGLGRAYVGRVIITLTNMSGAEISRRV